jgi:glycosyltransferase involved in cell wall biosynthesis
MKILLLSAHLPSPCSRQGGQKTSYYMCEFLARSHELHLISFATDHERESFRHLDMRIFKSWHLVAVTTWRRLCGVLSAPHMPLAIAVRRSSRFRRILKQTLLRHSYDVAIMDHTTMCQYERVLDGVPVVGGSAHDVLSQLWGRKAALSRNCVSRFLGEWEYRRVANWEKSALAKCNFILPHNAKDGELLRALTPEVLQCQIQAWYTPCPDLETSEQSREPLTVVFWGAMNRSENIDAVRFALKEIFPLIRNIVPGTRFIVAGNRSEELAELRQFRGSGVVGVGYIDNIPSFLSSMQVALLPLRLGAGIKIKTLECMAAGVAVVTTPVGIEGVGGLPGQDYLIGESASELAGHVVRLLRNDSERVRIATNGRDLIRAEHQFERSMRKLDSFLKLTSSSQKIPSAGEMLYRL